MDTRLTGKTAHPITSEEARSPTPPMQSKRDGWDDEDIALELPQQTRLSAPDRRALVTRQIQQDLQVALPTKVPLSAEELAARVQTKAGQMGMDHTDKAEAAALKGMVNADHNTEFLTTQNTMMAQRLALAAQMLSDVHAGGLTVIDHLADLQNRFEQVQIQAHFNAKAAEWHAAANATVAEHNSLAQAISTDAHSAVQAESTRTRLAAAERTITELAVTHQKQLDQKLEEIKQLGRDSKNVLALRAALGALQVYNPAFSIEMTAYLAGLAAPTLIDFGNKAVAAVKLAKTGVDGARQAMDMIRSLRAGAQPAPTGSQQKVKRE